MCTHCLGVWVQRFSDWLSKMFKFHSTHAQNCPTTLNVCPYTVVDPHWNFKFLNMHMMAMDNPHENYSKYFAWTSRTVLCLHQTLFLPGLQLDPTCALSLVVSHNVLYIVSLQNDIIVIMGKLLTSRIFVYKISNRSDKCQTWYDDYQKKWFSKKIHCHGNMSWGYWFP